MTIPVIHKIIQKDGGSIWLPKWYSGSQGWGNLAHPDVYAEAAMGQWPEGTIYREGHRTFVYVSHKSTLSGGTKSAGYLMETGSAYKDMGSDGMQIAAADATQITVNYGEACALDKYSGGIFGVYGTSYGSRYIVKQYLADGDFDMLLDLDVGFPVAMATTDEITFTENYFKNADTYVTSDDAPYIGVIMKHQPTAAYYSWLQCGGPHGMTFYWGSNEPDAGAGQFCVVAYHGTTQIHPSRTASLATDVDEAGSAQVIGYRAGASAAMAGGQQIWLTILN